jgi:hypothetical protein
MGLAIMSNYEKLKNTFVFSLYYTLDVFYNIFQ